MKVKQYVRSISGRDAGIVYLVTGVIDERYVLVANGDTRTLAEPKRKNVKHLEELEDVEEEIPATDAELRMKVRWVDDQHKWINVFKFICGTEG